VGDHTALLGQALHFNLIGSDPDAGTTLTYSAAGLPEGAMLNPATGAFSWTPGPGQAGDHVIAFGVFDGEQITSRSALLRATTAPQAPRVTIELTPSFPATPGQGVQVHAVASSLADIVGLSLT